MVKKQHKNAEQENRHLHEMLSNLERELSQRSQDLTQTKLEMNKKTTEIRDLHQELERYVARVLQLFDVPQYDSQASHFNVHCLTLSAAVLPAARQMLAWLQDTILQPPWLCSRPPVDVLLFYLFGFNGRRHIFFVLMLAFRKYAYLYEPQTAKRKTFWPFRS